jgi:type II secretory pathway component GspD/PulD (secretin)
MGITKTVGKTVPQQSIRIPKEVFAMSTYKSHLLRTKAPVLKSTPSHIEVSVDNSNMTVYEPTVPSLNQSAPLKFVEALPEPKDAWKQKLVNLNLSSTAIETVASILSKQTGVNIVLLSKPNQKVTISVNQMPIGDALKHLATIVGLRTVQVKNAVVMAEESTLKSAYPKEYDNEYSSGPKSIVDNIGKPAAAEIVQPPVEQTIQRVYTLRYQGATQMVGALKEYFATKKVTAIAIPNTILPNLGGNSGASSTGNQGGNSGGSANNGSGSVSVETRTKKILLSGPTAAVEEAILMLQVSDLARNQVEVTVTIHDVSNDALREAGVTWDFGQTTVSEAVNGNVNVGTFSRTGLSFVGTIHALEQANKAKLLASPNLSVMDGELGSILIGEKRRFPVVSGTTTNGQFIYSTEEQNVGISLLVSPDISDDGTVTMAVNAQVSSILGFLQLNGGSYPQIATRESKSTLHLKDGQTMLMGGLLKDEEIVNLQKVPYLSQIPFFGELFKNRKTQKNTSQLLISITPHIIKK